MIGRLEERLAANARWIFLGLVVFSILLRVVYFAQIDGGPCSQWHRWEDGDPNFFDLWGRRLAAGDWLTDGSLHPLHEWHKSIAREYYLRHASEERELRQSGQDPARVLWDRWYGGPRFHQEPLYPYLVGATYRIFGADPRWVYTWQMLLGVLSNVLAWWIARRHFGETAGVLAAGLALLCGPLLFYEMTLIRTSLTVLMSLALLVVFERAFERGSVGRWAAAGAVLGAALLLQTVFILFGVAAMALLAWRSREKWREGLRAGAAVALAAIACLAPAFVRNALVGAPLFGLSSVGAVTFAAANWPEGDPTRGWTMDRRGLTRLMSETEGGFGRVVRQTLDTHSPWTFTKLMGMKAGMLTRDHELPNNKNFLYYRLHAPILHIGFAGFGLILPFALFGMYAAWKEAGRHALLYALVVSSVAPMLIFYVLGRFRAPLMAALIPFAAFGMVRLAAWVFERRWKPAGVAGSVMALSALWMFRPLPEHMRPIRSADYRIAFKLHGAVQEREASERSDWGAAADALAVALREEPEEVRRLDGTPLPEGGEEIRRTTDFFRSLHARRAGYLERLGRREEARRAAERAEILRNSLGGVPSAPWNP